jgi:hypothetical protein
VYLSYNFKQPSGGAGILTKMARFAATNDVHSTPYMGYTGNNGGSSYSYLYPGIGDDPLAYYSYSDNLWYRDEYWLVISSPGGSDGQAMVWRNGQSKFSDSTIETKSSSSNGEDYQYFFLPYYNEDATRHIYVDNVYVDNTRARVELCDTPAFPTGALTAHCEVQIPSSWSSSSIQATVNVGTFSNGQTAYLYVVDSQGLVNLVGMPVTIGGSGQSEEPPNVEGLHRSDTAEGS